MPTLESDTAEVSSQTEQLTEVKSKQDVKSLQRTLDESEHFSGSVDSRGKASDQLTGPRSDTPAHVRRPRRVTPEELPGSKKNSTGSAGLPGRILSWLNLSKPTTATPVRRSIPEPHPKYEKFIAESRPEKGAVTYIESFDVSNQTLPATLGLVRSDEKTSSINDSYQKNYYYTRRKGSPNPCRCFSWCCGGKCNLYVGCYIIGASLFAVGLIQALILLTATKESLIFVQRDDTGKFYHEFIAISAYLFQHKYYPVFIWIKSIVFEAFSRLMLLIGTLKAHRTFCCIFIALMIVSIVWAFVTTGIETRIVMEAKLNNITKQAKMAYSSVKWISTAVLLAIQTYFIICGVCLWRKLIDAEYFVLDANVLSTDEDEQEQDQVPRVFETEYERPDGIL